VIQHPCFWPPSRQLAFLQDASDRFEILERDPPHPWLVALERSARKVIPPGGWMVAMSSDFVESLGKYRKVRHRQVALEAIGSAR
jgi:serine/threonine-protein kinase/endoribonuclease IRE1